MDKGFIIQNIQTEEFVSHNGGESPVLECDSYPFDYISERDKATVYPSFEHVCFVATWYLDCRKQWRIIDTVTEKGYIKNNERGFGAFTEEIPPIAKL